MTDKLNEIKPGVPLTDKDKEALAKSNAESSAEAHRLAAEQRARDNAANGNEKPPIQSVADSIKTKLEREEFHKPE